MVRTKIVEEHSNASPSAADELASTLGPEPKPRAAVRPLAVPSERRATIPVDMVNEQALIVAAMDPSGREPLRALSPDHFFVKGHAEIWRCLKLVDEQGLQYSPTLLRTLSSEKLDVAYLELLAKAHRVPDAATLRYHAERLVWDKARIAAARGPLAELLKALQDPTTVAEAVLTKVDELRAAFGQQQGAKSNAVITGRELAQPLTAVPWILPELGVMKGRPILMSAYAGSGKTPLIQDLALGVASGQGTCWDGLMLRLSGPVLHLDYEVGPELTRLRYQRLAAARGIDLAAVGDQLRVLHFPERKLLSKDVRPWLERLCQGVALLIVDTLDSAAGPGWDEVKDGRVPLDLLNEVGNATGCVVVVLHHDRKTTEDNKRAPRLHKMRGGGAIAAAAGAVLAIDDDDREWRMLREVKDVMGRRPDPIRYRFADGGALDPVTELSAELAVEREKATEQSWNDRRDNKAAELEERNVENAKLAIVETLRKQGKKLSKNILEKATGKSSGTARRAIAELIQSREVIIEQGPRGAVLCSLPEQVAEVAQ